MCLTISKFPKPWCILNWYRLCFIYLFMMIIFWHNIQRNSTGIIFNKLQTAYYLFSIGTALGTVLGQPEWISVVLKGRKYWIGFIVNVIFFKQGISPMLPPPNGLCIKRPFVEVKGLHKIVGGKSREVYICMGCIHLLHITREKLKHFKYGFCY